MLEPSAVDVHYPRLFCFVHHVRWTRVNVFSFGLFYQLGVVVLYDYYLYFWFNICLQMFLLLFLFHYTRFISYHRSRSSRNAQTRTKNGWFFISLYGASFVCAFPCFFPCTWIDALQLPILFGDFPLSVRFFWLTKWLSSVQNILKHKLILFDHHWEYSSVCRCRLCDVWCWWWWW